MQYRLKILPRWIIFLLDLFCIQFSLFFSFLLRFNFNLPEISSYELKVALIVAPAINAILFYLFKSYAGIIRHTNIEDTFRLLIVNFVASLTYFAINLAMYSHYNGMHFFPFSVIAINFFTINFILISYRLLVRYCFKFYSLHRGVEQNKIKAAVYDTSEQGLHIKSVINDLPGGDIYISAFLDDIVGKGGKLMEGLPIYH